MNTDNNSEFDVASTYTVSIHYDWRLYKHDIAASIAHVRMLGNQGIIPEADGLIITQGLAAIEKEIENGTFPLKKELEDIHMNIEARLFNEIGDVAGRLHTARSRNDQVAVDMRLYTKGTVQEFLRLLNLLQSSILNVAEAYQEVVLPGYTHLQRAQPILFAHHLLAYFHMFQRDKERFQDCYRRVDVLPLGSGAIAGVPYPIDREFLALELGFAHISENSMDAVSDRDYLIECMADAAMCMAHISRLAEELVLWSSSEFNFIQLADRYTTGSSMMPQKRNPDFAELARGKTGRVYGHLVALLTVVKGLPLTYNRDLQEDKEGFFDTVDTLQSTLHVCAGMVGSIQVNADHMLQAVEESYILATDMADYLVVRGVPFREAHGIMARLSSYAIKQNKLFKDLTMEEYLAFSTYFQDDVYDITPGRSIAARDVPGGTAHHQVSLALAHARVLLEETDGQ